MVYSYILNSNYLSQEIRAVSKTITILSKRGFLLVLLSIYLAQFFINCHFSLTDVGTARLDANFCFCRMGFSGT